MNIGPIKNFYLIVYNSGIKNKNSIINSKHTQKIMKFYTNFLHMQNAREKKKTLNTCNF